MSSYDQNYVRILWVECYSLEVFKCFNTYILLSELTEPIKIEAVKIES